MKIEEQTLRRLWPHGDTKIAGLIEGIAATSEAVFARRGIKTLLQVAHIMAQLSHECGAGLEVVENLNYTTPNAMMKAWPKRFPTVASTAPYLRNPRKLADFVYNGRMGNRPGTDDGYDFRGRGGSQTTGREAYEKLGRASGHDLIADPDTINDPDLFFDFAVADFIMCGCLRWTAPRDGLPLGDVDAVTLHLNGGYNGKAERRAWFRRWCDALGVKAPAKTAAPVGLMAAAAPAVDDEAAHVPSVSTYATDGVLRYGQDDNPPFEVKAVQDWLKEKGYRVGKTDGDFSTETRGQILIFQADNGLPTTGEVDEATKEALKTAPPKPVAEARETATADDLRAAGSQTVATADKLSLLGKVGAALGVSGGAANKAGLLDHAKDAVDQVSTFREVVDNVGDLLQWAGAHWYIWAALAGAGAWYLASKIIAQRVQDHRSGANMSR
ncbi:peptidoglycan-binding protein [Bradyrhizobium sp. USDA 4350]